ncbi:MAG: transcriptional repressor NrdR [Fusobacteriaceae bacterium]|jgi:transcriptional repressor NrdR|nr:transcriptional repressor NrdR [Fusobacteriales bacterium]MDN5303476.1 transcriptional repressor NrdR [Fusobacteriaceae bacterium]
MRCPYCKSEDSKVIDSRNYQEGFSIKRRRECINCGERFTTYERVERLPIHVVKRDGSQEDFDRDKVLRGLLRATIKRDIKREELEKIVDEIEMEIEEKSNKREIKSSFLGELIMEKLKKIDEVAYVRFASVYKKFDDLKSFIKEIETIKK